MKYVYVVWAVLLAFAAPTTAQFETATVVGTVRDSSGAVLPQAQVTLLNVLTGVSAERTSDGNGNYEFFTVRIGSYLVTAEKPGFSTALVINAVVVQTPAQPDFRPTQAGYPEGLTDPARFDPLTANIT